MFEFLLDNFVIFKSLFCLLSLLIHTHFDSEVKQLGLSSLYHHIPLDIYLRRTSTFKILPGIVSGFMILEIEVSQRLNENLCRMCSTLLISEHYIYNLPIL